MPRYRFRHALVAVLLFVALLSQGTWALAGTTGGMSGTVTTTDTNAPVANAKVTVSSPSQTAIGQTDATGRFTFISLAPDTYTVSLEKVGFQPASTPGVTVFADSTQTIVLHMESALKTIAATVSRATGSLVKPGTTADVYSISASQQDKVSALGGGGSLNSAYSAIASVPGAYVPLNQTGYFQTVHIRGGDYDQIGYELDGVPVNRSFDNYPSGAASSLGQQELQVYTGANPASSEGQGLAGFINQVIKVGTYPGFGTGFLALGSPQFYHRAAVEVGGASPNRNFSYYVGIGGYNQEFRYIDQSNGTGYANLGPPANQLADPAGCASPFTGYSSCYANDTGVGPGGYQLYPYQYGFLSSITDRDLVANVHFALPHKNDGGRDDVQLLWNSGLLNNGFYSSNGDSAGVNNGATYLDARQWNCPVGVTTNAPSASCVSNYLYPTSPQQRAFGSAIGNAVRDTTWNNQEVVKLQYQKNIGTDAFFRIYGYTYYSDWLQNGPNGANLNYIGTGASPDYELSSHTRGVAAQFSKQLNAQNLINIQGSYTTASTLRDNNTQLLQSVSSRRRRGLVAVNAANPLAGYCFDTTGAAVSCSPITHPADWATYADVQNSALPPLPASCNIPGGPAGPCTWLVAENSRWATYNTVKPTFSAFSITDEFRPNDQWLFNIGLRSDSYSFQGSDTRPNDPARQFWYKAWNNSHCIDANGVPQDNPGGPGAVCPAGFTAANMVNASAVTNRYTVFQPRLSGTYTLNPDTVVRFSGGKYAEPPNSAFEQYDTLQEDSPFTLLGVAFYKFGFTTPSHAVRPPTSLNFDLSLEKRLHGTDVSFKLTPFLRKTKDQIQQFFLDQATGFVSGLNVGRQTSEGFEFQLNKGDFARNGLSGQLSFAYTYSFINYDKFANGSSVVTGINSDIAHYNTLTSAGGGAKCYTTGGTADNACIAGSIANPYYNAPAQALLDPNGKYPTYDLFPGGIGSSAQTFGAPYVASLILNYKHDKLSITPSLQYVAGARYGAPQTTPGIDPSSGCAALTAPGATTTGDPRYPYGAVGGSPYDATSCASTVVIPDPYTKGFDGLGAFLQPAQIIGNLQISYEASSKITFVGTFANVVNRCFGGTKAAWTINDSNVCSYGTLNNAGSFGPVGNVYNWTPTAQTPTQRLVQYPYGAYVGAVNVDGNSTKTPFNFFIEARIKL